LDYVASNCDKGSKSSIEIGTALLNKMAHRAGLSAVKRKAKPDGQTLGNLFEDICASFIEDTFLQLSTLRPGVWVVEKTGTRSRSAIGKYEQYSHLKELDILASKHSELRNFLGDGYTVAPDVVVARLPEPDSTINKISTIVDEKSAKYTKIRSANHENPCEPSQLLHASISCKFTMRSDRSQNTRTEALNLIRSRKGQVPHIVAVTAEPTASRIASLALGTGDIDCVYHAALFELLETLKDLDDYSSLEMLEGMVEGKRLKDISDLPLDLAI